MQRARPGPKAAETTASAAHPPYTRLCASPTAEAWCSAFDLCGCPQRAQLVTKRQHGEQVQEHVCRRALRSRADGLGTADHSVTEEAVNARLYDRVLRRCHAAPRRCGTASELSSCDASPAKTAQKSPHVNHAPNYSRSFTVHSRAREHELVHEYIYVYYIYMCMGLIWRTRDASLSWE